METENNSIARQRLSLGAGIRRATTSVWQSLCRREATIAATGRLTGALTLSIRAALFLGLILFALLPPLALAQTWNTGYFRSADGYGPANSSLSGTPTNAPAGFQWQTTDPNDVNGMFYRAGWTLGLSTSGNKSVLFGGYNAAVNASYWPGVTNPVLYRDFASPISMTSPIVVVSMDFGILPTASGSFTNKDIFSFDFLNASSASSLAKISFNPAAAGGTNNLKLQWTSNGTNVASDGVSFQSYEIQYAGLYRLTAAISGSAFDLSLFGMTAQTNGVGTVTNFAVTSSNWVVKNGQLSGSLGAEDFDRFAIDWDLSSGATNQPGGNYMNLNTVSVSTAVPEPSTFTLLGAVLATWGAWQFRRRR